MNQKDFEFKLNRIKNNVVKGVKLTHEEQKFMGNVFVAGAIMYGLLGMVYLLGTVELNYLMEHMKNVDNGSNRKGENR